MTHNIQATMDKCERVAKYGEHGHFVVYERTFKNLFRKKNVLVCWGCEMRITEP